MRYTTRPMVYAVKEMKVETRTGPLVTTWHGDGGPTTEVVPLPVGPFVTEGETLRALGRWMVGEKE